ncbi:MAG TPA: alpha-glucosidase [Lachnospiraceae bacterium]|nr:alpha-glucosidase [Lachnospiraceae bacterium]
MLKKWWQDKTVYQIYPKSFCDSNGDGIGDLKGIISRLDMIKELGADMIWLSPIYCSPLADQGYDISDYYRIDPRFGTMEDMDELIAEGKKRGIGIIMDLVVNHCSDEHEWFKKACEDPDGKYGKFFYIETVKEGEKLPCNWRSYFGGSVWEKLPGHEDRYYLHVFHKKQPDLNWENPELRNEIYKMINWWLDKGLAGFRIDAIINIKKTLPFHDYPADRDDGMTDISNMLKEAEGIGEFLGEMRDRCFLPHDAFSAGEVFNVKDEQIPEFIGENGYFSTMFDFNANIYGRSSKGWYDCKIITPDAYRDCCFESQRKIGDAGFLSNIIENHDEPRGVSHYIPKEDLNDASKKLLATVSVMLRGIPFIYQGQELGMENIPINSIDEVDDISSRDEYEVALRAGKTPEEAIRIVSEFSRDNARTPYQWNSTENAGFTSGKPWLRVNPNYREINFENEEKDPDSVLSYYKKLLALRKNPNDRDTLIFGSLKPVWEDRPGIMAYERSSENQKILIAANFSREPQAIKPGSGYSKVLLNNLPELSENEGTITLGAYQAVILEI